MKQTENQDSSLKGSNLIFLISQPRAGSTLTQRILGGHPDIHTVSEPWLMLSPLTSWHSTIGYNADYDQALAQVAVSNFIGSLSDGEEDYVQGLRRMYSYLYEKAREEAGKRYFLDKTPRYFYIVNELYRTFPEARFIFLFRNPLSVLCSIVATWANDDLHDLYTLKKFKNDLFIAPHKLLEGVTNLGKQCLVIHYEWLLMKADEEIARVCDFLGISFRPELAEYGVTNTSPAWMYGDQTKLYQDTKPDSGNLNKWLEDINQPQIWRLASDYLQILGEETIEKLGYSYQELSSTLRNSLPTLEQLQNTLPLTFYCEAIESKNEVSSLIKLTQKGLGAWIGAKREPGEISYGLPIQKEVKYQESLTRVHKESQKLQAELDHSQSQLGEAQTRIESLHTEVENSHAQLGEAQTRIESLHTEVENSHAQLGEAQTRIESLQTELERSNSLLGESESLLNQYQEQLNEAHLLLEQYQDKQSKTQEELELAKSQLQEKDVALAQSQEQVRETQEELELTKSQLQEKDVALGQSQEQVRETQEELELAKSQLQETETVLQQCYSQLQETERVLELSEDKVSGSQAELNQTKSQLYQSQWELERVSFQQSLTKKELEELKTENQELQGQLGETNAKLLDFQSQGLKLQSLQQVQTENHRLKHQQNSLQVELEKMQLTDVERTRWQQQLMETQDELNRHLVAQEELERLHSQVESLKWEVDKYKTQLQQTQDELEKIQQQAKHIDQEANGNYSQAKYKLLVSEGWYAYQSGDLAKMQKCLQDSLEFTSVSRTQCVIEWLETFAKLSAEKGYCFDTYTLTNSQEWKRLIQQRVAISKR